ncbi:MAG: indolepyruvate oxidoreductase subunit beta [Deltaproteobacteria bacterium]|nr:indolepyruvate oxidoreductase subunit beta [Deltaproteobacteria bacterium]
MLSKDPYNLIITGVGGQGNVLASRMLGNLMSAQGLSVTIGETFGASQRGGSVMSHLRISSEGAWSPQIPAGGADMVVALEPIEALRVLARYGNPKVKVLANSRSIYPVGVISGELAYPSLDDVKKWVAELSDRSWFIDATEAAMNLGSAIFGNVIMVGALAATKELPIHREAFGQAMEAAMGPEKAKKNLKAFDIGVEMVGG